MNEDKFTCCGGIKLDDGERCPVCGERNEEDRPMQVDKNELEQIRAGGIYTQGICLAMLGLGKAIEAVLNMKDMAVLDEMEHLCSEMFKSARAALDELHGEVH